MDKKYLINCALCEKELEINEDIRESIKSGQDICEICMDCQKYLLDKVSYFLSLEVEKTKQPTDDDTNL